MATCKIGTHVVAPNNNYIFDTNVWMFLFAPIAGVQSYKQERYTKLLSDIMSRGATVWISSIIVSEYVNAVLRLSFSQWKENNMLQRADFKRDFRSTQEYKTTLQDINNQLTEMFKVSTRRPDDFNSIDIISILDSMGEISYDFGDAIIVDCCRRNKSTYLVTDDSDITKGDFPFTVITA